MRLYLIGFMGSGKTHTGKQLAERLVHPFIDLDLLIEAEAGTDISTIFEEHGEEHFRQLEQKALHFTGELIDVVVSTGGGTPCFFDNMEYMNSTGITFYIDTDIHFLMTRLSTKGISKRPLLKKIGEENLEDGLKEKLKERLPYYSQAQVILSYHQSLENDIVSYVQSRIKTQN